MEKGRFGIFGGQYVPETLMNEIHDLTEAYERYKEDSEFQKELGILLNTYAGRPSSLYYAKRMTEDLGGARIYLKRASAYWLKSGARRGSLPKRGQGSTE